MVCKKVEFFAKYEFLAEYISTYGTICIILYVTPGKGSFYTC